MWTPPGTDNDLPGGGRPEAAGSAGIAGAVPAGPAYPLDTPIPAVAALAATIVARMDPRTTLREGERARIHVDLAALHFFDPETGATLRT